MKKIFVVIGKSATGKDSLYYKMLEQKLNLQSIVLYYTRPMRPGEVNGKTYHFISNEEMEELKKSDKMIHFEYYPTDFGGCTVALMDDYQFENAQNIICVMSLKFYHKMYNYFKDNKDVELIPIYVEVSARDRMARAMKREEASAKPNYKEICRRFVADEDDFTKELLEIIPKENRFVNNDFDTFFDLVLNVIKEKIK